MHNRKPSTYGIDTVEKTSEVLAELSRHSADHNQQLFEMQVVKLNYKQLEIFEEIKKSLDEVEMRDGLDMFYIDAPGGCGKTYLLRVIAAFFRSKGLIVSISATTGVAAKQYPSGVTNHNRFILPIVPPIKPRIGGNIYRKKFFHTEKKSRIQVKTGLFLSYRLVPDPIGVHFAHEVV